MSEKLKEVCAYIRVSTDKQEELSPESQIRLIKDYAEQHNMLLTRIYQEDKGISGKKADKRPAFQEMIATCKDKSHPYDAILLWKFSRFARNIDESTYYKSVLRKKCNVDVISVSEPITEGMYGRLIEMVIEWSDEFYLYNLSGEVMRGMTQKALKGGYNSNVPIGYVKERGRDKIPQIEPKGAEIVKKIFDMYTEQNIPMGDIAARLNKAGYRTARGSLFETRVVGYILENPFYIGKIRWNFFDKQSNKRKNPDDVIISDGKHEAIISDEQFSKAANRRAHDRLRTGYNKKRRPTPLLANWLSGMIKCSKCGASLGFAHGTAKVVPNFCCWKYSKGLCSTRNGITLKNAEKEVLSILEELSGSGYFYNYNLNVINTENTERAYILKELKSLDTKMKRIKDAYINEIDTLEEYKANKELINKRREELNKKLESASVTVHPASVHRAVDFQALIDIIKDENSNDIEKHNALLEVVDHFVWDKETQEMTVVLNGDISLANCK